MGTSRLCCSQCCPSQAAGWHAWWCCIGAPAAAASRPGLKGTLRGCSRHPGCACRPLSVPSSPRRAGSFNMRTLCATVLHATTVTMNGGPSHGHQGTQVGVVPCPRLKRLALPCLMHSQARSGRAGAVPSRPQPGGRAVHHCVLFGLVQRAAAHMLHDHCMKKLSTPSRMVQPSWSHRAGTSTGQCYKAIV